MEQILLNKIKILELQLSKTQDAWMQQIWQDHIKQLIHKVSRLKK